MQTLTADQLREMKRSNGPAVINVLDKEVFRKEHIPGSRNIPLRTHHFAEAVEKAVGGKDKPVIVYCASTTCDASPKAAKELEKEGFGTVYDFEGGMKAWKEAGFPVESDT